MMFTLQALFLLASLVASYIIFVRPVLRARPSFASFYATSDNCIAAVKAKFAGIKTRTAAAVGMAVSAVVAVHDFLVPIAAGVDWTPLAQKVPSWLWPIILFAGYALISWFRSLTDRRNQQAG